MKGLKGMKFIKITKGGSNERIERMKIMKGGNNERIERIENYERQE